MDVEDNNDDDHTSRRRSRRLAARLEDKPNQLVKKLLKDLDKESTSKPKSSKITSEKIYNSMLIPQKKKMKRSAANKTLFEKGVKAQKILGATYVDDEKKGSTQLCYLVKFENGQFQLVLNKLAHRFCPMQVIDFLESNVSFKDDEDCPNRLPETTINITTSEPII